MERFWIQWMRPVRCLMQLRPKVIHPCTNVHLENSCAMSRISFSMRLTEVLIVCQSCFNETLMFHQIMEANDIQKKVDTLKRHVGHRSNSQLGEHCRIITNVEANDFYDGTWACKMQGKYLLVSLLLSLIAQIGQMSPQMMMNMCMGTHNATEMISLCQVTLLWWNESMHSSNQSVESVGATVSHRQQSDEKERNNTRKCSLNWEIQ